ncbi:MAG: FAD-dependent oxidoreductase [Bdellovibrionota bacterium]
MIHIIGAGFSGLTLAWELQKAGLKVTLYEKNQIGGLIQTITTATHLREMAANGLLWTPRLEQLAKELEVEFLASQKISRKRFIFRDGKAQRWPLNLSETFCLVSKLVKFLFFRSKVDTNLTLSAWSEKNFGQKFTDYFLTSAVRGIFALPATKLNAKAVLDSFKAVTEFKKAKKYKPTTYAPPKGMGQLIQTLKVKLIEKNVQILQQEIKNLSDLTLKNKDAIVIATAAWDAASLLPQTQIKNIEAVPLISATLVWPKETPTLDGFGCLFPPSEKFFSAGVLVNSCIFSGRGPNPSETWIISQDPNGFSDEQIKKALLNDRQKLFVNFGEPSECHITRWPKAIPAYNQQLNSFLAHQDEMANSLASENIFLSGNYLGKIGLAKIYDQNIILAEKLKAKYG